MARLTVTLLAIAAPQVACAQDRLPLPETTAGALAAAETITAEDLVRRISVLAHDSMAGRNTPSPELDAAAAWIADRFEAWGLRPGASDGSFIQRYPLRRGRLDLNASYLRIEGGPTWKVGTDLMRYSGGTPADGITAGAHLVAGPVQAADARRLDIQGEMVLWIVPSATDGRPDLAAVNRALGDLVAREPAAVVLVTQRPDFQWNGALRSLERFSLAPGWQTAADTPLLEMRDRTVVGPLARRGIDVPALRAGGFHTERLPDLRLELRLVDEVQTLSAPNVIGILPGSDPELRQEYLLYSAHIDHVGVAGPDNPQCAPRLEDTICNGADDDASGTAAIMEVAEAFSTLHPRPRRSLVFLGVSGEEHGLWGSEYFATHPSLNLDDVVANLNVDMVGRNWSDTIVAIGKEHSDLGRTLRRVHEAHPELNMTPIDDPWPQENFYGRSDHFNFARRGVPILFFFNGTHPQYHQPDDEVELIDGDKTARIARLLFYLGLEIANADDRPVWNPASRRRIVDRN